MDALQVDRRQPVALSFDQRMRNLSQTGRSEFVASQRLPVHMEAIEEQFTPLLLDFGHRQQDAGWGG